MATSSIFAEHTLTDERSITRLVEALESSEKATKEMERQTEPAHWLTSEEVKSIFGTHDGESNG